MENTEESDANLVKRLQEGDMAAFDVLFDKYRRGLFAYVWGMLGDRALSEDIVQEAFVTFAQKVKSVDPNRNVAGWIYRVARNRTIDLIRRRKFEVFPGDPSILQKIEHADKGSEPGPADYLIGQENSAMVRQALATLPAKERDILLLRFYGDLTFKEIASVVRRPLGTVLWQSRRTLEKLRRVCTRADQMGRDMPS